VKEVGAQADVEEGLQQAEDETAATETRERHSSTFLPSFLPSFLCSFLCSFVPSFLPSLLACLLASCVP
jgi:hypothetical protein